MGYDYQLRGSVGAGGLNQNMDNFVTQSLINTERNIRGVAPIGVDGQIGGETIDAITEFQKLSFGFADGRVDPNGRSYRRLLSIFNTKPDPNAPSSTTYRSGLRNRYFVTVSNDGRIFVNPGDTLSRYSAAIYKDYFRFGEFGRIVKDKIIPIPNPNLILAGEILCHIPTYNKFMEGKALPIPIPPKFSLPPQVKKGIYDGIAKKDFNLKGDFGFQFINDAESIFSKASGLVEILSIAIPGLEALSTSLSIIGIPISAYANLRDFLNVSNTDSRMYGLRASAYAITAWTFDDKIPESSPQILINFSQSPTTPPKSELNEIWKKSANAAVSNVEDVASKVALRLDLSQIPNVTHEMKILILKSYWRNIAYNNKKIDLYKEMMGNLGEMFLKDATPQVKNIWRYSIDDVIYPY